MCPTMIEEKLTWRKVSGVCGILTPIVAFACTLLSIAFYPQFSWTNNALSDLGVISGPTSAVFNSGLIVSGVLIILFGTGLPVLLGKRLLGKISASVLILDAIALGAIGVFPENARPIHYYASVAFFALLPVSMFLITATFLLTARRKIGLFTLLAAVVAAAVWIAQFSVRFVPGAAVPEAISALSGLVWFVVLGFKMMKETSTSRK